MEVDILHQLKYQGQTFIREFVENQADLTLEEIRDEYNEHFEPVKRSTIDRALTKLNSEKKDSF